MVYSRVVTDGLVLKHSTSPIRVRELQRVLAVAPEGVPLAIVGDFNEEDGFAACGLLRDIGMADALGLVEVRARRGARGR